MFANGGGPFLARRIFWKVCGSERHPLVRFWGIAGFGQLLECTDTNVNGSSDILPLLHYTITFSFFGVALCNMMSSQNDEDPFLQVQAYVSYPSIDQAPSLTAQQRRTLCAQHCTTTIQILSPNPLIRLLCKQP
jgi:hypothetical protein